jgi:hypothetical protein
LLEDLEAQIDRDFEVVVVRQGWLPHLLGKTAQ